MQQDPGSRKKLFRIPDPWAKKGPHPGSATLVKPRTTTTHSRICMDMIK
jgi:hypothetical protein